jgi:hypothetical protein
MKVITGTKKGFFALSNDTARQISHCIENNEEWFVRWSDDTLYCDPEYGDNVWEYYFKQQYPLQESYQVVGDYTELVLLKDNSFRATMNYIYNNHFILNDSTVQKLSGHYELFERNNILGVHIRRTDKFLIGMHGTTFKHAPVDLALFQQEIDKVINNYDYLYLATDCEEAVRFIKECYGKKVIYNINAVRGQNAVSIHDNYKHISGYIKGLNVLTDVILLSKCKHLIRSSSNVSITSLYLNLNLTQSNLNEKYHGDSEAELL